MLDSTDATNDDLSDDPCESDRTLRPEKGDRRGLWVPPSVAGAAQGSQAQWQWRAASDVHETIRRIRGPLGVCGCPPPPWLRDVAADTLRSTGPDGKTGAFGQLRGHLFEHLDIRDYNLRRGGVYRLVQRAAPNNPGYDASRFDANGRFAGAVQHKSGSTGIRTVIRKLEARKPGSACKATIRVPADRVEACRQAAGDKIRVQTSRLTNKSIARRANAGLRDLAAHGEAATSLSRHAGRAAGKSAAVSIAVGGLVDLNAFLRHNLNARQFVARRGVDAAQAGLTAAATTTTIAGVTAGATFLASTAAAGTLAATVAGTVAASTVVLPAAVPVAVGYGVSLVAKPARRYVTDRLRSRAGHEREASTLWERPEVEVPLADRTSAEPARPIGTTLAV